MLKDKIILNNQTLELNIRSGKSLVIKGHPKASPDIDAEYTRLPKNIMITATVKAKMPGCRKSEIRFYFRYTDHNNHCFFSIIGGKEIQFAVIGNGTPVIRTSPIKITEDDLFSDTFTFILSVFENTATAIISDTVVLNIEEIPETEGRTGISFLSSSKKESFDLEMENLNFTEEIMNFEPIIRLPRSADVYFMQANDFYSQNRFDLAIIYYKRGLLYGKADEKIYNRIGNLFFLVEEYNEAVTYYKKALSLAPRNKEYKKNLGRSYIRLNNEKEANALLDNEIKKGSDDAELLIDYSSLWMNKGEYEKALFMLNKAYKKVKDNPALLYKRGKCLIGLGDVDEGKKDLLRSARLLSINDPSSSAIILKYSLESRMDAEGLKLACGLLEQSGDHRDIYELVKKARLEIDIDGELIEYLTKAELALDLPEKALDEISKLKTGSMTPELRRTKLKALIALGRTDEAKKEADFLFKNRSSHRFNVNELIYYRLLIGNVSGKSRIGKEEMKLLKKDKPFYEEALAEKAKAFVTEGENKKALDILEKLGDDRREKDPKIYYYTGLAYFGLSDLAKAKENLYRAHDLMPSDPLISYVLSAALYYMNDYNTALKILNPAYNKIPDDGKKDNLMGNIHMALGLVDEAQAYYNDAVIKDPGNEEFALNLAESLYRQKDYQNSYSIVKKVLKKSGSKNAESMLMKLRAHLFSSVKCSGCGREWIFLKDSKEVNPSKRKLAGLTSNAPAGECPKCGRTYCIACVKKAKKKKRSCLKCNVELKYDSARIRIAADNILKGVKW